MKLKSKKDYLAVAVVGLFVFVWALLSAMLFMNNPVEFMRGFAFGMVVWLLIWSGIQVGRITARN